MEISQNSYVYNCTFNANEAIGTNGVADGEGGAIWFGSRDAPIDVCNCVVYRNRAEGGGSAFFITDEPQAPTVSPIRIGHCTITQNAIFSSDSAQPIGGAIYYDALSATVPESIWNTIVYGNTDPQTSAQVLPLAVVSSVDIHHCCVTQTLGGQGNFNANPLFVSATNLRLQVSSPCLDSGSDQLLLPDHPDLDQNLATVLVSRDWTRTIDRSIDFLTTNVCSSTTFTCGETDMGALEHQ